MQHNQAKQGYNSLQSKNGLTFVNEHLCQDRSHAHRDCNCDECQQRRAVHRAQSGVSVVVMMMCV
eukprot:2616131-Rhodomonas_salina.1